VLLNWAKRLSPAPFFLRLHLRLRNSHCTGFMTKTEIEVENAPHGRWMDAVWRLNLRTQYGKMSDRENKKRTARCLSQTVDYPLMATTLKPQSTDHYTAIGYGDFGTLTVDGWAVTFGTARRGLSGPRPVPSSLYQM